MRAQESAEKPPYDSSCEKIGMDLSGSHTEQLATFTNPQRIPQIRVFSLVYMTFLPEKPQLKAGYGASDARWFTMGYTDTTYSFENDQQLFNTTQTPVQRAYYANVTENQSDPDKHLAFDLNEWILKVACD